MPVNFIVALSKVHSDAEAAVIKLFCAMRVLASTSCGSGTNWKSRSSFWPSVDSTYSTNAFNRVPDSSSEVRFLRTYM